MRPPRQTILALALLVLAATVPAVAQTGSVLDVQGTTLDGAPFSGESLVGKAVLLDFWGTWCAPCVHAFPTLSRLHDDFGDELQVVGLAFYSGELSDIAAFAAKHELEYTVVEGSEETLETFGVFAFPSYVLISAEGEMLFAQSGEESDLYERVAKALGTG